MSSPIVYIWTLYCPLYIEHKPKNLTEKQNIDKKQKKNTLNILLSIKLQQQRQRKKNDWHQQ